MVECVCNFVAIERAGVGSSLEFLILHSAMTVFI